MSDDMPEWTEEDWSSAIRASDRHRMARGEFQPGDVELIRKFLRLSSEQMTAALGFDALVFDRAFEPGAFLGVTARQLLLLAIREPGAFRRALVKQ